jgi:hypothetical protein
MRIENLIENNNLSSYVDVIENTSRRSIFESIGQGDVYFTQWEKEIHPILCEVALTPDQIQQLFTTIEKGSDRTLLGKVKDAPGKISDAWFNKFGGMLQNSGPVKAFDAQYDKIVSSIAEKYPEIAAKVKKYQAWAKENPNLQKFLLAIVGSVAAALGVAAAGGVAAGALTIGTGTAIAVGIVNIADRLLKGEKASTAIGRGATAGAVAGMTAGIAAKIGQMAQAGFDTKMVQDVAGRKIMSGSMEINGLPLSVRGYAGDVIATSNAFKARDWDLVATLVDKMADPEYVKALDLSKKVVAAAIKDYDKATKAVEFLTQAAAAASGAVGTAAIGPGQQASGAPAPKESFTANGKKLSEGQVYMVFNRVCAQQQLNEGPMDFIKGAAAKGIDKLKTVGKNLTTKVTADKLNSAWKKAGSPMDSEEVAKILTAAGVSDDVIKTVYTDLKISSAPAAQATTSDEEIKKLFVQLNTKDRTRMIAYLTKQIGTA